MTKYESIEEVARDALEVQNACNLSGVLHTWAAMQPAIRDAIEASAARGNFPEGRVLAGYELHAVQILMLSKVLSLMKVDGDCIGGVSRGEQDLFRGAYAWANDVVAELKVRNNPQ